MAYPCATEEARVTRADAAADAVRRAFAAGSRLDLAGGDVAAALLVQLLIGEPPQHTGRIPALRLSGAMIRDRLALPGARVDALVELSGCTFDEPIDLYAADLAGWRLTDCRFPGLRAANLRVRSELGLERCTVTGPVELPDARVEGPLRMAGTSLQGPTGPALTGIRMVIAGVLDAREARVRGGARLDAPRRRPDGSIKPSLDARATTIGKDFYASRGFTATGGVRLSLAEVSKSANFDNARLGGAGAQVAALRLRRLTCQELRLRFAAPPQGDVLLTGVVAGSVYDSAELWAADGEVDVEDFRYQSLTASPEADVATRLGWLRSALPAYDPDPYDQLAACYRDGGHDDLADSVLLAKQRHRHSSQGVPTKVWGWLQEWTVGYGYRPWRAALWLVLCWLLGSIWFAQHPLPRLDNGQSPSWQPVLYAADLLIPVVNLGQDGLWRTSGSSAWVAGLLTAAGWLLLSTAATGVTRILTRR